MLRTIILEGELGEKFGREWKLAARSPAQAIRLIQANTGKFFSHLMRAHQRGMAYAVFIDDRDLGKDELETPAGQASTIRILPVLQGSKDSGLFQVILGIIIIVVVTIVSQGTLTGPAIQATFSAGGFAQFAAYMGMAMVLGGVATMMTGTPKFDDASLEPADNKPSYQFNGPTNRTQQGNCIPVIFGKMLVGSQVISAGIRNEHYAGSATSVGTPGLLTGGEGEPDYGTGYGGNPGYGYFDWTIGSYGSWTDTPVVPYPDDPLIDDAIGA